MKKLIFTDKRRKEYQMMMLIVGGSGSGKSSYAEECVGFLSQRNGSEKKAENQKYYLATMQVFDGDVEAQKKVERHRRLRHNKGYITIEQPTDLHCAVAKMNLTGRSGMRTALLECVSNLTVNEMFSGEKPQLAEQVSAKVIGDIEQLTQSVTHLVVVSSNVFEDGIAYDETTMEYIRAMGIINQRLAAMADRVVEVVAGLPVLCQKGD